LQDLVQDNCFVNYDEGRRFAAVFA
jgi:hypothetical protein